MSGNLKRSILAGLVCAGLFATATMPVSAQAVSDSQLTVSWNDGTRDEGSVFFDEFKNFTLTVSQTENLTNQGLNISWAGLNPSIPGEFSQNYIQLMQCWGDENGPSPQQCQWGGASASTANLLGTQAAGRDLSIDEDPLQSYDSNFLIPPPRNRPNQKAYRVPFRAVDGVNDFNYTKYFDSASSNEVTAAVIGADGSGQSVFEVQTLFEAPHLGCGADTNSGPQSCWLVAVPRGTRNANGTQVSSDAKLTGSPLSASNWANRIQVPLRFSKVTAVCPIGNSERRVVGNDVAGAAVTSWQPALCKDFATFGYTQIGDTEARTQILSTFEGVAGLALVNRPIDSEALSENVIYSAPVLKSAIVVGFNIDRYLKSTAPNFDKYGTLVEDLTLNPRLIAKLLTQSYRSDVPGGNEQEHVKNNPRSLATDPEFLELNPEFLGFNNGIEPEGLIVALGASDVNAQVWQWLQNDSDAREYLEGKPDQWGMVINKFYLNLELATDPNIESFPKADLSTYRPNLLTPEPGFGTLDLRPYVNDMQEAALAARRADAKSKTVWDVNRVPPAFTTSGGQIIGQHFELALTTYSAALRYGLGIAKLVDSSGQPVAPNQDTISAAVDDMPFDEEGKTKIYNPSQLGSGSYPLATLTYAVVNPCTQSDEALQDYADFLSYASEEGQQPGFTQGSLPAGYATLSDSEKADLTQLASKLTSANVRSGCPVSAEPVPSETPLEIPSELFPPVDYPSGETSVGEPRVVPNIFKTIAQTPGAANALIISAGLLGVPGFLGGQLLLATVRRKRQLNASAKAKS